MFEELNFGRREIEFKSGSIVEFCLYFFNKERCNIVKVSSFRDILPNKFIFVFNGPLLPWSIWIGKEDRNIAEHFGNILMRTEFTTVIGCYGPYSHSPEREQESGNDLSQGFCIFSLRHSRLRADWLIPTNSAISFLDVFFWSKTNICDLCSEVNCLYIAIQN